MADTGAGEKLKVFISYSRRDSAAFADELHRCDVLSINGPSYRLKDRLDLVAGRGEPMQ